MVIDQTLLTKIKASLRISHTALDDDIRDTIAACLQDLSVCGVVAPTQQDPQETDPLILNAIKLYCRAETTDDTAKAAAFKARYDSLKACLMMAQEYKGEAVSSE